MQPNKMYSNVKGGRGWGRGLGWGAGVGGRLDCFREQYTVFSTHIRILYRTVHSV